jgi:hypothetical protein
VTKKRIKVKERNKFQKMINKKKRDNRRRGESVTSNGRFYASMILEDARRERESEYDSEKKKN